MDQPVKKRKVFLLTNKFPYGFVETFIEAELEAVPDNVELTIVPTQVRLSKEKIREVPSNITVEVLLEGNSKIIYPIESIKSLFTKEYWAEVRFRKQKKLFKFSDYVTLAGFFGRAREISKSFIRKHERELKEEDIVLYSYWFTTAAFAEMLINRQFGKKTVTRAHGTDVYDGHCVYQTMPGQKSALTGLNRVYVCSKDGMRYLQNKYPEAEDKITYSYLGTQDYGSKATDHRMDEFVICSCSRLVPVKRVHLIAEALRNIQNANVRWIHIGDGIEKERVDKVVQVLPENIRTTFTGNLSHDDVMKFYQDNHIDLFVNVSESEGLPVSIMEVLSFGIPVVATNVGGTGEIVNQCIGELLDKDFAPEVLTDLIVNYLNMDEQSYTNKRTTVRKFWEEHFSAINNYRMFYEDILK